ncbi:uncharacterized protein LOC117113670 [Anneissia japonica]|uniref:uncharacterized protein LOC117113670 n=1 Tax=Anneissia japonica TaxID=1529436 RepID=UPI001425A859|nr:uncharacterized protein LOC117113670 [Anneissia japonica]
MDKFYSVSMITIINHVGSDSANELYKRLIGAYVSISDRTTSKICGQVIDETMVNRSAIVNVICNPPLIGQFVNVNFGTQNIGENICEVRVYSDEIEISECFLETYMQDYRGIVGKTASGYLCQKWSVQWPHTHSYAPLPHNLCRAVTYHEVWCYTVNPAVRWERCDIPALGETCPRAPFTRNLHPLNTCYRDSYWLLFKESMLIAAVADLSRQTVKINVPMNIKARIPNDGRFQQCGNTLTLAFYIFPYRISNGPIIAFGNDNTRFSIVQTLANDALYNSEVIVYYGLEAAVNAKVLLPETWTFLAVTFDGQHKVLRLWRDGEIASIGNTGFTSIRMDFDDIEVGSDAVGYDGVVAEVGYLQIYDRILNEAEMKAARDKQIPKCDGLFHVTSSSGYSEDQPMVNSKVPSTIMCAFRCHQNLDCFVFRYNSETRVCTEYQTNILDASNNHPIYKWKYRHAHKT